MFRAWEGLQLVSEIHTEEEEEILSYEYSYPDKSAPFPDDLWVSGDEMPPPTGLPRPQTLEELYAEISRTAPTTSVDALSGDGSGSSRTTDTSAGKSRA